MGSIQGHDSVVMTVKVTEMETSPVGRQVSILVKQLTPSILHSVFAYNKAPHAHYMVFS